ncbi:hypothetical protein GCM10010211_77430 [Streptomyces albospinus]|uniref:Uncharacterized protein n=1 Tax=Streptomyces albospinus TaxID=285515 RepID=A0ABQ2VP21_9ACTN|nr:hypothetical protein GCM10010211_77430 [Streptomyces albospinus]
MGRRRFCRIPPASPVPRPTTLIKLVRHSGGQAVASSTRVAGKASGGQLVSGRRCRALSAEMRARNRLASAWDLSADSSLPVTETHVRTRTDIGTTTATFTS